MQNPAPIKNVSVVTTGYGLAHVEHVFGTRKPTLWWILFGKKRTRLPINAYVIEHADGLVLFDAGADPRVVTDPDYWPTPLTRFLMGKIFAWEMTEQDNLANRLKLAGYAAADVSKVLISHFHADHVGGIREVPQAELYAANDAWEHMLEPHAYREMVLQRDIAILGAKWNEIDFQPTDDPSLAPFTEAFDLMGDGSMIVLPTPGHMPGSVSMLVKRSDGPPLLLVGDLTYGQELLEQDRTPATGDTDVLLETFANVRALQETLPGLVILPAHDLHAEDKLNQAASDNRSPDLVDLS